VKPSADHVFAKTLKSLVVGAVSPVTFKRIQYQLFVRHVNVFVESAWVSGFPKATLSNKGRTCEPRTGVNLDVSSRAKFMHLPGEPAESGSEIAAGPPREPAALPSSVVHEFGLILTSTSWALPL